MRLSSLMQACARHADVREKPFRCSSSTSVLLSKAKQCDTCIPFYLPLCALRAAARTGDDFSLLRHSSYANSNRTACCDVSHVCSRHAVTDCMATRQRVYMTTLTIPTYTLHGKIRGQIRLFCVRHAVTLIFNLPYNIRFSYRLRKFSLTGSKSRCYRFCREDSFLQAELIARLCISIGFRTSASPKCFGSCCPDNRCSLTLLSRYSCYIMGCWIRFRQGKEFFRLHALQTECGTDIISYIWVTQAILWGIRSFSLTCISAEFKNAWSSAHTPLCVFIAWFLIKAGDFFLHIAAIEKFGGKNRFQIGVI